MYIGVKQREGSIQETERLLQTASVKQALVANKVKNHTKTGQFQN
jgi:hypothetical protein